MSGVEHICHQPDRIFRAGDLRRLSRRLDGDTRLHTPLMAVTNAISAVIIVGALLAAAVTETTLLAVRGRLASWRWLPVNIFGGFLVTKRMLEMFKKKRKAEACLMTADIEHERRILLYRPGLFHSWRCRGLRSPPPVHHGQPFWHGGMAIAMVTTVR